VLQPEGTVILTLSDGKDGVTSQWSNDLIEKQLIPYMGTCGYRNIEILRGQNSRQYHVVSIRAQK
jgi:hypothetical protein